jgi:hypothetical protein
MGSFRIRLTTTLSEITTNGVFSGLERELSLIDTAVQTAHESGHRNFKRIADPQEGFYGYRSPGFDLLPVTRREP